MRIYGASDDLIEIEQGTVKDEIYADRDDRAVLLVGTERSGLVVTLTYAPRRDAAVWQVAVEPVDEGVPIPWPVRVEAFGYTACVLSDCPQGTPVRRQYTNVTPPTWVGLDEGDPS
jgi:hypothetical protein